MKKMSAVNKVSAGEWWIQGLNPVCLAAEPVLNRDNTGLPLVKAPKCSSVTYSLPGGLNIYQKTLNSGENRTWS